MLRWVWIEMPAVFQPFLFGKAGFAEFAELSPQLVLDVSQGGHAGLFCWMIGSGLWRILHSGRVGMSFVSCSIVILLSVFYGALTYRARSGSRFRPIRNTAMKRSWLESSTDRGVVTRVTPHSRCLLLRVF